MHARVKIYPQDYFSPIVPEKQENGELFVMNGFTQRTVLCHHFACSWHDDASPYSERSEGFSTTQNLLLHEIAKTQGQKRLDLAGEYIASANVARDAKEWGEAETFYHRALNADPGAEGIWVQLGHMQREQGRIEDAKQSYPRALSINDENADTQVQIGRILKRTGRLAEASARFRYAAKLDPNNVDAQQEIAQLPDAPAQAPAERVKRSLTGWLNRA